jgi:hypothetical protein
MKPPTKNDVIAKFLFRDEERFLKRYYRFRKNELTYSKILRQFNKEVPGIRKQILKRFKDILPGEVQRIITVHRVMMKHYNFSLDMEDIMLSHRIEDVMSSSIYDYCKEENSRRFKKYGLLKPRHKKKEARKELKARGFVKLYEFEDYNPRFSHIVTNQVIDGQILYYPKNFTAGVIKDMRWWDIPNVYIVHGLIGVSGFTKVSTPQTK